MKIDNLKRMTRGWLIGNFEPSVHKTESFEVCVLDHPLGSEGAPHYHKDCTEITVILEGKLVCNGNVLEKDDIFVYEPGEVSDVQFLEHCRLLVIKTNSNPEDKYYV